MARSAIEAIIFSLLVIFAYVAFRFEPKYAVPVIIAVIHDILITGGVYSLTGREVTSGTVAAFLTILGYSLYDTVIVFDRVRENVPRLPRATFSQIVNRSMSEVLTRSLITGLSSVFLVTVLFIFGGATLKDFAFAMMVGLASGTYSSIFIASPVLTHWKEREPAYRRRRERIEEQMGRVPRSRRRTSSRGPRAGARSRSRPRRRYRPRPRRAARRFRGSCRSHPLRSSRPLSHHKRPPARDPSPPSRSGHPAPTAGMALPIRTVLTAVTMKVEPAATVMPRPAATAGPSRAARAQRGERRGAAQGARAAGRRPQAPPQAREEPLMARSWSGSRWAWRSGTSRCSSRTASGEASWELSSAPRAGAMVSGAIAQIALGKSVGDTDLATALYAVPGCVIGLAIVYAIGVRSGVEAEHI